ncbi:MAG TPA: alpha/beta hydrolase [Solirubrobacterales bacterium]|jgi:pimeloyl-ACP methyl ester carboxylesterase|nr:alpha/beta hydrolase [Solirubrobacterales bacterium]
MTELPRVEGVRHRWVRARGVEFHLAEAGGGEDVVLCLHGWPQHWYEWRALMPALADRHRVLALDLRGFGWSDAPESGYEKEELASDLLAVLDELGIERAKLVGHDWGGWIGFLLCLREPQRFERFLALNILPPWTGVRTMAPHLWRFWYQWLILSPGVGYRLHRGGKFVPKVLVGGSVRRQVWDQATRHAFSDTFTEPARARAAVQMYRVFNLREMPQIVRGRYADARLRVPTRLLFGTGDSALRHETLAGCERRAEEMEVELVENCGHFIADEMPDLVAEKARAFFS